MKSDFTTIDLEGMFLIKSKYLKTTCKLDINVNERACL